MWNSKDDTVIIKRSKNPTIREIKARVNEHMKYWGNYGVESILIREGKIPSTPPKNPIKFIKYKLIIQKKRQEIRKQMIKNMQITNMEKQVPSP